MNIVNASTNITLPQRSPVLEPKVAQVFRLCFSALICSSGIMGNVLVCIITLCNRKAKFSVNYYVLNLAIADLGALIVCYPLTLVKAAAPLNWPLGKFFCKVLYPLSDIFYGASIGSIVAIAIDRYGAIVHSLRPRQSLQAAKRAILLVWILAFVGIVLPLLFVMTYTEGRPVKGNVDCTPHWPGWLQFALYVCSQALFWYVLPLCIILWAYRKIAAKINESKTLHKSLKEEYKPSINRKPNNSKDNKKVDPNTKALKILVPIVVVFAVTMLPFHVYRVCQVFIKNFYNLLEYPWLVYNFGTIFLLTNSSANPLIYSLVSKDFRRNFKRLICFQWKELNSENATVLKMRTSPVSGIITQASTQRLPKEDKRRKRSLSPSE